MVAEITRYPDVADGPIEAEVLKVLGDPDDPRTEVEKVLACADVAEEFPDEVARIADGLPREVAAAADRADRADLRHIPFTTIDPETARDFDDAVAIEKLPHGGTRLWVAVADVSHYVREGSPIDDEARRRGCSIYLPNRAIPMLPEPLSARMCSLVPEEDRLAMVVRIDLDQHARGRRARLLRGGDPLARAARLSRRRGGARRRHARQAQEVRAVPAGAAARWTRWRASCARSALARGSLDFDLPEPYVELDDDDPRLVRDIRKSRRDPGERQAYSMIEEFMLAANEAVAGSFRERGEDTLWRIHDAPDRARLEEFAGWPSTTASRSTSTRRARRKGLQARARPAARGTRPRRRCRSSCCARSSRRPTTWSTSATSAWPRRDYLHFTSPIRRYPDLIVHRLLKIRLAGQGKPAGGWQAARQVRAAPSGPRCRRWRPSRRSPSGRRWRSSARWSTSTARSSCAIAIGDVFEGTISGVTGFGVFVVIDEPFVEGLVRIEALSDDYYNFDEPACRLVGRRSGRAFALGDTVKVEVQSVSVVRRKIDFALAGHARASGRAARAPATSARARAPAGASAKPAAPISGARTSAGRPDKRARRAATERSRR